MERSKAPKDVLELGRHLVRELGLADGVDTLGRWMAHHLAELLHTAENGATAEERQLAEDRAVETILKIWDHRTSLPGNGYPLARYNRILQVLERLRPNDNPFAYFGPDPKARREQQAGVLFDRLSRLVIVLLLKRMPPAIGNEEVGTVATEALTETEQHVLRSLEVWSELFDTKNEDTGRRQKNTNHSENLEMSLDELGVELIDELADRLAELRGDLTASPPPESG